MEYIVPKQCEDASGGVYVIHCGKCFYVGRTKNFRQREQQHLSDLRCGRHCNVRLQRSFNKYGESSFRFVAARKCGHDESVELESRLLAASRECDRCANLRIEQGNTFTFSEETRRKMSERQKGRKHSPKTKQKIGDAHRGRKYGPEHGEKVRKKLLGRKLGEETKRKMSEWRTGRKRLNISTPVLEVLPDNTTRWHVSFRAAADVSGLHRTNFARAIDGKSKMPARLAGHRFYRLDRTRENWSIFPTACTHEHYGSDAP